MPINDRIARTARSQRGVTLVESLVALALLALASAAVGRFMTGQIRHAGVNVTTSQAYSYAADEIERIRALPYAEMSSATQRRSAGAVTYTIESEVSDGVPAANMKLIEVAVSWGSPHGVQTIDVETVYTQVTRD